MEGTQTLNGQSSLCWKGHSRNPACDPGFTEDSAGVADTLVPPPLKESPDTCTGLPGPPPHSPPWKALQGEAAGCGLLFPNVPG